MSYLTVRNRGGLGMISFGRVPAVVPGTSEVKSLVDAFNHDTLGPSGRSMWDSYGYLCANVPKDRWPIYMRKLEELKALYPDAVKANPMRCFPTMVINGKIVGTDRDSNRMYAVDWYNQYGRDKLVNLDLSPAVNTVARGTPASWNVIGMMPQNKGSYGYAFMDEGAARNYAQAIVDAGGSATIYQEPQSQPVPPLSTLPNLVTSVPVATPGGPAAPAYDPTAPYKPSYGAPGGATVAGTPTYQPPPVDEDSYQQPGSVIVAPTSTAQGVPVALDQSTVTVPQQQESGGFNPIFLLAIPAAIFMMKK